MDRAAPPSRARASSSGHDRRHIDRGRLLGDVRQAVEQAHGAGVAWADIERVFEQCRLSAGRRSSMLDGRSP